MKERLIEILKNTPPTRLKAVGRMVGKTYTTLSGVADHLIANDVVEVCRCKDCVYSREDAEIADLYGCSLSRNMQKPNDYCSYGRRKEQV
jgi:predicted Zn-ribbon and HTH transcriptional regulator